MLHAILVGLDGTTNHSTLVELGIHWAKQFDCLLVGLTVVDEAALRRPSPGPPGGYLEKLQDQWVSAARHEVENVLERFTLQCSEAGVACKLLEEVGAPAERIMVAAQRYDLVLLGRHACYHEQENHRHTLQTVLRVAPRPVVVVPDPLPSGAGGVLLAYDGSPQAARALQLFVGSGLHRLGDVQVLSIDPAKAVEAARTADRAVEFLALHGISAQPHAIVSSDAVAGTILSEIRDRDVQLAVMGAYGKPALSEFLLGSATSRVIAETPVPLFLYH
jgi:nucleotide-binding universal stress UspA family protein